VTSRSLAQPRTTRHHRVDGPFLELLEENFGISTFTLSNAFLGFPAEPKKSAIALCVWASRADDPARALLAWARSCAKRRSWSGPGPRRSRRFDLAGVVSEGGPPFTGTAAATSPSSHVGGGCGHGHGHGREHHGPHLRQRKALRLGEGARRPCPSLALQHRPLLLRVQGAGDRRTAFLGHRAGTNLHPDRGGRPPRGQARACGVPPQVAAAARPQGGTAPGVGYSRRRSRQARGGLLVATERGPPGRSVLTSEGP
jgi:hypothetical protein